MNMHNTQINNSRRINGFCTKMRKISLNKSYILGIQLFMAASCISTAVYGQTAQSGVGSTYANVAIAGSTVQWTNTTNASQSDDLYAIPTANLPVSGNYSDYLMITGFSFSIPTGSVISGISVSIERSDANGKSKDYRARIVREGTLGVVDKSKNPAWAASDDFQNYGGSNDTWGQHWTNADINSAGFGFAFAASRTGGGPQPTLAKIDQVLITIYYNLPLPVELLGFKASLAGKGVKLQWETLTETNNDYFSIERSIDGTSFELLQNVKGAGNTTTSRVYAAMDTNPNDGRNFYRLSQTDYDGTVRILKMVTVVTTAAKSGASDLTVIHASARPQVTFYLDHSATIQLQVLDMNGKLVSSQEYAGVKGRNTFVISEAGQLQPGFYVARLMVENANPTATRFVATSH